MFSGIWGNPQTVCLTIGRCNSISFGGAQAVGSNTIARPTHQNMCTYTTDQGELLFFQISVGFAGVGVNNTRAPPAYRFDITLNIIPHLPYNSSFFFLDCCYDLAQKLYLYTQAQFSYTVCGTIAACWKRCAVLSGKKSNKAR